MYPKISDGIVLTGFSMNGSFTGFFGAGGDFVQANLNQPFRFGNVSTSLAIESVLNMYGIVDLIAGVMPPQGLNYPNGYLTNTNINANQFLFFLPGYFDPGALLAGELTKQPVTVGELLTLGSIPMMNAYAGPVLIVTGCKCTLPCAYMTVLTITIANDLPYCGGNCFATGNPALASIPAAAAMSFPNVPSTNFEAYIQPNSGHGINFHYNATGAYDVINTFLNSKGLMPSK